MSYIFKNIELNEIIKNIEPLQHLALDISEKLKSDFPSLDSNSDIRITTLSKFINVINSTYISILLLDQNLLENNWWTSTFNSRFSHSDREIISNEMVSIAKVGFIQFIFSSIESGFRLLLRAIDPTACINGTAEFKSIYETLLSTHLSSKPPDSVELLDLLRLIRNTIHNNGVYFHRNGTDQCIIYKGESYNFLIGKPIDFVTWPFLKDRIKELLFLTDNIFRDQTVSSIHDTIIDPFAHK